MKRRKHTLLSNFSRSRSSIVRVRMQLTRLLSLQKWCKILIISQAGTPSVFVFFRKNLSSSSTDQWKLPKSSYLHTKRKLPKKSNCIHFYPVSTTKPTSSTVRALSWLPPARTYISNGWVISRLIQMSSRVFSLENWKLCTLASLVATLNLCCIGAMKILTTF